jgi:tetratricopeptide (TPR) repeat protein
LPHASPASSPSSRCPRVGFRNRAITLTVALATAWLVAAGSAHAQQPATPSGGAATQPAPRDGATTQQMEAAGANAQLDSSARARFRVGQSMYESGRFAEAAREFEAAYELSRRPELLFNIYVANRDDNNLEKAVAALREFLAQMPPELPNRLNLEARLQAMAATVSERASAAEASAQQAAAAAAAHERAAAAEAAREVAERDAAVQRERSFRLSLPGAVIGGVGVATAAAGFVVGALALGKVSDLEAVCVENVCPSSSRETYDSAQTLVTTADVLIIGGAVLAAAGLSLVLLQIGVAEDEAPAAASATASASCGPTGCTALVSGRF